MWYVYVDETLEVVPRIYYIGMGSLGRTKCVKRNSKHTGIRHKYGFVRKIVFSTFIRNLAIEFEKQQIVECKTFIDDPLSDDIACNFTTGGEGSKDVSEQTKKKLSRSRQGKKSSLPTRKKQREALRGRSFSIEHRRRLREIAKKKNLSEQTLQKRRDAQKKKVIQLLNDKIVEYFDSVLSAKEFTGFSNIDRAARQGTTAGGFHWKYV